MKKGIFVFIALIFYLCFSLKIIHAETLIVTPNLLQVQKPTKHPFEGIVYKGDGVNYLLKGTANKPSFYGCNGITYYYDFNNFEGKTLEVKFKRSQYGGFNITLIPKIYENVKYKQAITFYTSSDDTFGNICQVCSGKGNCQLECGGYAGGWLNSEYDFGGITNDNNWHIIKITKLPDKIIFNLDNGKKVKEVTTAYGCEGNLPVSQLNFKQGVRLMFSMGSCSWKSGNLNFEIAYAKISGNITNQCSQSDLDEKYNEGYNAGYEAGKKYCRNHPTECGMPVSSTDCSSEYQNGYNKGYEDGKNSCGGSSTNPFIPGSMSECYSTYNVFTNTLKIPCFSMENKMYDIEMTLESTKPIRFTLKEVKEKGK